MNLHKHLAAIEARADAATDGPWDWDCCYQTEPDPPGTVTIDYATLYSPGGEYDTAIIHQDDACGSKEGEARLIKDLRFAAAARTDVPALVAALRLAIEQRDAWHSYALGETGTPLTPRDAEIAAILEAK